LKRRIPILIFNYGVQPYLPYVMAQFVYRAKGAEVHLLGDDSNRGYLGVFHHNSAQFDRQARYFRESFVNLSTNPERFERVCFERWMIIVEFARQHSLERFWVFDSDIVLLHDLSDFEQELEGTALTLFPDPDPASMTAGPQSMRVGDLGTLEDFTKMVTDTYTRRTDYFHRAANHYQSLQQKGLPGGVCDMTFWYMWYLENKNAVRDLCQPMNDGSQFDIAFGSPGLGARQFRMENGHKFLRRTGDSAWGVDNDGNEVRFNTLHLQGNSKSQISHWVSTTNPYHWHNCYWIKLRNRWKRLAKVNHLAAFRHRL
jgi:hypothetical protein